MITVCAAMHEEIAALVPGPLVRGVVLGVGPEAAAESARAVARTRPRLVLHVGHAGGLKPGVAAGQALLVTGHSPGVTDPEGPLPPPVDLDAAWVDVLRAALARLPVRLAQGPILTVPAFLWSSERKLRAGRAGAYLACEMEAAVVAAACRAMGVPYLGLRAISDASDRDVPPLHWSKGAPVRRSLRDSARWFTEPWRWPDLGTALIGRRRAVETLATVVPAAVDAILRVSKG